MQSIQDSGNTNQQTTDSKQRQNKLSNWEKHDTNGEVIQTAT